jgi:hypothetical protein
MMLHDMAHDMFPKVRQTWRVAILLASGPLAVPPAILYIWLNSTRMHLLQPLAAAGATYHVQVCLDQVASKLGSTVTVSFSEQNSADGFLLPELKPL